MTAMQTPIKPRLHAGGDECALRQAPTKRGVLASNLVKHDHEIVRRNARFRATRLFSSITSQALSPDMTSLMT
jgi:hypothetical protein